MLEPVVDISINAPQSSATETIAARLAPMRSIAAPIRLDRLTPQNATIDRPEAISTRLQPRSFSIGSIITPIE